MSPKRVLTLFRKGSGQFILQQIFLPTHKTTNFVLISSFSISFNLKQHTSIGAASLFPDFIPEVGSIFKFTERPIPPYKPPR